MENRIEISGQSYGGVRLKDGNYFIGNSLACDELGVDTLSATLDGSAEFPTLFCPADADGLLTSEDELFGVRPYYRLLVDDPRLYRYGEPVYFYHGKTLMGRFYMSAVVREGKYTFSITCTSAVGMLEGYTHYGGIYTGQRMSEVLADIVAGAVEYSIDPSLAGIPVYGWLPVASARSNLHQLLFAMGASVRKDTAGLLAVSTLSAESPTALSDDRQFLGGTVKDTAHATRAEVTEHTYLIYSGDERVTLYEGDVPGETLTSPKGAALAGVLVTFDSPVHDLLVENGSILESGVNYAVLGPGLNCKLTGQKYTHTTRVVTVEKETKGRSLAEVQDKTVRVETATLVCLANSENVARRALAYYGSAQTIQTDIVVGTERPGDAVSLTDPFGDPAVGFIKSMDVNISGLLRGRTEIVSGYIPVGSGNFYNSFETLTGNGVWTVPVGVSKIRVVLVGAGAGGDAGNNGKSGGSSGVSATKQELREGGSWSAQPGAGGEAGLAGAPGRGGQVYQTTIDVTPGQRFVFTSGTGGIAGKKSGEKGAPGNPSVFGNLSSSLGTSSDTGYTNIMSGVSYARKGTSGTDGGKGGKGGSATSSGAGYGEDGGAVGAYAGGRGLSGRFHSSNISSNKDATGGGAGGGASVSKIGGNAYSGEWGNEHGGAGADAATVIREKNYGDGGDGGSGGGGGGGAGGFFMSMEPNQTILNELHFSARGGAAGAGSPGTDGAPGCVVVYF